MLPELFSKAVTAVVTGSAGAVGKAAGFTLARSLFSDSSGQATGRAQVAAGKDPNQILLDDKVDDFPKLTPTGFLSPVDYRRVGADDVTRAGNRSLENIMAKMMNEPVFKPDAKAAFIATQISSRSVVSNSASRKFSKYVKGLS